MSVAVISLHDVAPSTMAACQRQLELVESIDARCSLLVVAGPWKAPTVEEAPSFAEWLREAEARGHEVVVHGWEHRAVADPHSAVGPWRRLGGRWLTRGCAEFATLSHDEAVRRAAAALKVLIDAGTSPVGFTPPGWLASPEAEAGLTSLGFDYTTTRTAVIDLVRGRRVDVTAISHRSGSPLSGLAARTVEAVVRHRSRQAAPVRLALHPPDVHDARLARASERAVEMIGASELVPITYAELIRGHRHLLDGVASCDAQRLGSVTVGPVHANARLGRTVAPALILEPRPVGRT